MDFAGPTAATASCSRTTSSRDSCHKREPKAAGMNTCASETPSTGPFYRSSTQNPWPTFRNGIGSSPKQRRGREYAVSSASFSLDETRIVTASKRTTPHARDHVGEEPTCGSMRASLDRHFQTQPRRHRLLGYPDDQPEIDFCEGIQ